MAEVWSYTLEFRGEHLELEEHQLVVGRSRTCDVPIKDPSVSRRHAELTPGGGRIRVRDLGSSNGTFINGQRVTESGELGDGDSLGLGDADIEVRVVRDAAVEIPRLPGAGRPGAGRPAAEPAPPAVVRPAGPVGEATGILQAQSMRLAEEALDEAAESTDELPFEDLPPLLTEAPGAHMAPPRPAAAAAPEPPAPLQTQAIRPAGLPEPGPPELPESPMRTQAIPHLDAAPELPESPMRTQAIPHLDAAPELPASPMRTQAIPHLDAGPELPASPMRTQAIPHLDAGPELPASPLRTQQIRTDGPPPALEQSEPETEKVSLVEPPPAAPPPAKARPVKDVREGSGRPGSGHPGSGHPGSGHPATPGSAGEPLPPPSGGKGEILPSLDGFDTTLGPGVEVPESMRRARESMAKAKEAQQAEGDPLADLYSRPIQLPPVAGFGIRALALVADGAWIGLLELAGWRLLELPGLALAGAAGLLVVLAGWSVWGTTPGKRLFSLYVCTREGQAGLGVPRALLRLAAYLLSGLLLGAGFLIALAPSRLALHDRLAGTAVRRFR